MSGHSKWATIKRKKGVTDAKRGQLFTKLGNTIAVAAKNGGNPDFNPALELAIEKAKSANMPNVNIERSIKRGTGELGGAQIQEMVYEGYGSGGVAVVVECASDNKNRTYSDVRTAFSKNGGNIAETGAVAFQFERKAVIEVKKTGDDDGDQLTIIEAGADDIFDEQDAWLVQAPLNLLKSIRLALTEAGFEVISATPSYVPKNIIKIQNQTTANKIIKLIDVLEDLDDVIEVYSNFDIDET